MESSPKSNVTLKGRLASELSGQVKAQWAEGVLTLEVDLPTGSLAQWEAALLAAVSHHDVPFRASVRTPEAGNTQAARPLPFTVRSVVTNPLPYVVLDDGRRVATGGEIGGWRILAIDQRGVRFEDPAGHPLTLER